MANVDGRNVPFTVGYHKVTVEIRDQIARTTVEESFADLTDGTLEGVFYFPLPAGRVDFWASACGSATAVEADIVEKQRAREIYEIIKSEHRDAGLLEWQGGTFFGPRLPHSAPRGKTHPHHLYASAAADGNTFR